MHGEACRCAVGEDDLGRGEAEAQFVEAIEGVEQGCVVTVESELEVLDFGHGDGCTADCAGGLRDDGDGEFVAQLPACIVADDGCADAGDSCACKRKFANVHVGPKSIAIVGVAYRGERTAADDVGCGH